MADVSQADGSILASAAVDVVFAGGTPPPTSGTSWLDRPLAGSGWNAPGGSLPLAPAAPGELDPDCAATARPAETPEEQQVVAAGWRLFDAYQGGWGSRLVFGTSVYDGMCRPNGYQAFVFAGNSFAGTLAPEPMDSRTDGALGSVLWTAPPPPGASAALQARYRPLRRATGRPVLPLRHQHRVLRGAHLRDRARRLCPRPAARRDVAQPGGLSRTRRPAIDRASGVGARPDVLVQASARGLTFWFRWKRLVGSYRRFTAAEPPVRRGRIGLADPLLALEPEEVDVHARAEEAHRGPEPLEPGQVRLRV